MSTATKWSITKCYMVYCDSDLWIKQYTHSDFCPSCSCSFSVSQELQTESSLATDMVKHKYPSSDGKWQWQLVFFLQTQSRERCSAYITDSTTIETIAVPFPISQVEPFTGGINRKMGQGLDQLLFITHDAISQWLLLHPEYSCFPFYAYIHICYL